MRPQVASTGLQRGKLPVPGCTLASHSDTAQWLLYNFTQVPCSASQPPLFLRLLLPGHPIAGSCDTFSLVLFTLSSHPPALSL